MKLEFTAAFEKDLGKVKEKLILSKVNKLLDTLEKASSLSE